MGSLDKEIDKIRSSKAEVDFNLINKILISLGYTRRKGNHNIYTIYILRIIVKTSQYLQLAVENKEKIC